MRILAIGDPHGKLPKNLDKVVRDNKPDIIICTGDIPPVPKNPSDENQWTESMTKRASRVYVELTKKLSEYNIPIFTLRGNMFRGGKLGTSVTKMAFKHKNITHKEYGLVPVGGVKLCVMDFITDEAVRRRNKLRESKDLAYAIKNFFHTLSWKMTTALAKHGLERSLKRTKDAIVVVHNPPYGHLDQLNWPGMPKALKGKHAGSKFILKMIKEYKPKLVLCSHIHEAKGIAKIGKTTVVNCGSQGSYAIIDINKEVKVDLK